MSTDKTCESFETTIEAYVAGELDDARLGPLLNHSRGCRDCRQLLELHRDLSALASRAPEPAQRDFDGLHARVLRRVESRETTERVPRPGPWLFTAASPIRIGAALAAAVLLFVVGLEVGRLLSDGERVPGTATNGSVSTRLVNAITADAASNRQLTDVEDSRFTYSNVSFRHVDGEQVALDFDVTTHVQLMASADSEIVRELLVHALLNPSSIGSRLKAMTYAASALEPKVRDALIFALHRDENLAVRLKALTLLADHLVVPEVESAVLAILRDDESVQMRLMALEFLVGHSVDRTRIRDVIEENEQPGDAALRARLTDFERRL